MDKLLDDAQGLVILVVDGKDDFKVGVLLEERGFKVLVEIRVEAFERADDGHAGDTLGMGGALRRTWATSIDPATDAQSDEKPRGKL